MTDYRLLIDGALVEGADTIDVLNPATGTAFAVAPRADHAQLGQAVEAARRAFPTWAAMDQAARAERLEAFASALDLRADELARLLTQEQGKPLAEARFEVGGTIAALRYFAGQSVEPRILRDSPTEKIIEHRTPLGVVAAIVPWNFPLILLMVKLAPALVTGNVVIAKPAPTTPLTTLLLGEIAADILPAGVFQTLADANDLGAALAAHPDVAMVAFTGSTATGRKVLAGAAETLKRFTLELGGNDAAIILDDADLDVVAPAVFRAATSNAGQICLAAKRIYAPEAMYDRLCTALAELAEGAVVGDGLEQGTQIGPIQNKVQYDKLLGYLEDAHASGTVIAGGKPIDREGFFIAPTVVRDIADDARLVAEEQFGPIIPVLSYSSLDEVIERANQSEYGLGGTIWTSNPKRGEDVAMRIDTGTVWVNKHLELPFDVAFGGAKQSGLGRQQGEDGLEEFTQPKIVNIAR